MLPYLSLFLIVTLLAIIVSVSKNKGLNIILITLIILILSIFGGARNLNIGTDVSVYGNPWFEIACSYNNVIDYINHINSSDIGYVLLNYIVSRFTNNVNIFLFVLQLISNSLILITLYKHKEKSPFWLATLAYICIYYCISFNILRQSIALAFVFYSINFLEKKKDIPFFITIIIAAQFHYTAYFALIIYLIYKLMISKKIKNKKNILVSIVLISTITVIFLKEILTLLYQFNIINYRIYNYIFNASTTSLNFNYIEILFKVFFIFLYLLSNKWNTQKDKQDIIFIAFILLEFILYQTKAIISYTDRLSFYFGYFSMISYPMIIKQFSQRRENKLIIRIISIAIFLIYWYYKFVYSGSCEVFPYESNIFNNLKIML